MRLAVLGSGSGGNAAVLEARGTRLLLDAGLSAKQLCQRLELLDIDPDSLDGILLSHEHSDHTRGLEVFLRKRRIPVFANALTRESLAERCGENIAWRLFQRGESFEVGKVEINSFAVPHDAVDPVGFVCSANGSQVGFVTDFGHVTTLVRDRLRGVRALFVEANYDQGMLDEDTKRPWSIKQRISSRHGHLSNAQTADLVCGLLEHGLETVVLGHLSRDCNCPEIATAVMRAAAPAGKIEVHVAWQEKPTAWVEIREESPELVLPVAEGRDQMDLALG
ncbi:MAG: MBL fold metallo-hydrolase [Roseibacillus sp.]|nr:MBL fold metallo-hydrolase [Roseibacillus sp.]